MSMLTLPSTTQTWASMLVRYGRRSKQHAHNIDCTNPDLSIVHSCRNVEEATGSAAARG